MKELSPRRFLDLIVLFCMGGMAAYYYSPLLAGVLTLVIFSLIVVGGIVKTIADKPKLELKRAEAEAERLQLAARPASELEYWEVQPEEKEAESKAGASPSGQPFSFTSTRED